MLAESHVRGQGKAVKRCYIQRRAAWYSRSLAIVLERPARVVARRVGHDDLLLYYTLSCVDIIGRERRREGAFNNPERRNWVKATRRLEKRHVTFLIYQKKRKNGEERRISLRVVCVFFFSSAGTSILIGLRDWLLESVVIDFTQRIDTVTCACGEVLLSI